MTSVKRRVEALEDATGARRELAESGPAAAILARFSRGEEKALIQAILAKLRASSTDADPVLAKEQAAALDKWERLGGPKAVKADTNHAGPGRLIGMLEELVEVGPGGTVVGVGLHTG